MSQNTEHRTQNALVAMLGAATGLTAVPWRNWREAAETEVYPVGVVNVQGAGQESEDEGGRGHLMWVPFEVGVLTDLANDLSASQCGNLLGYVRDRMKSATLTTTLTRLLSATVNYVELSESPPADISDAETNARYISGRLGLIER